MRLVLARTCSFREEKICGRRRKPSEARAEYSDGGRGGGGAGDRKTIAGYRAKWWKKAEALGGWCRQQLEAYPAGTPRPADELPLKESARTHLCAGAGPNSSVTGDAGENGVKETT